MRFLLVLLLVGCGHVHELTAPPQDWPPLRIREHGTQGLLTACSKYTTIFTWPPAGCAEIDFKAGTCDVWFVNEWTRTEELKHCAGRDHQGESTLADALQRWKAQ